MKSNVIPIDRRQLRPGECLYCFLIRMMETVGCDHTHASTLRWITAQPRSARWVLRWAESQHGICDCEVVSSVFRDEKRSVRHRKVRCALSYQQVDGRLVCGGVSAT
jgi:hypothetical protein